MDLDESREMIQVHFLEKARKLHGTTGRTIQLKRGGRGISPAPGSIEAKVGIGARGNRSIVRKVSGTHIASRLGGAGVPDLRDRLTICKGPGQGPAINSCRTG